MHVPVKHTNFHWIYTLVSVVVISLCAFLIPAPVHAVACNFYQAMSSQTKNIASWTTPCAIASLDGIDLASEESSTTNTASLTLGNGGAITINDTGVLILGAIHLGTGSVSMLTGGTIQPGAPLYMTDADTDGWPDNFTLYSATASGRRRLGLMRDYGTLDCSSSNFSITNICCTPTSWYQDADGDTYGNPGVTQSSCTQPVGYVANNTDCADGNANAKPGSATCSSSSFTNNSGQASWDWNCSQSGVAGGGTVCGTDLTQTTTPTYVTGGEGIGSCKNNNAGCRSSSKNTYPAAAVACGATGATCTANGTVGGSCGSCGTTNGGYVACIGISAGSAQTCQ